MDKLIYYNQLFDIYQNLFTENQQEIFKLYYEENLSLQEIGDLKKVSRSFVSKSINQTVEKLDEYESILKCLMIKEKIDKIKKKSNKDDIIQALENLY